MTQESFDLLIKRIEESGMCGIMDFYYPTIIDSFKSQVAIKYHEPTDRIKTFNIGYDIIFFSFGEIEDSVAFLKQRVFKDDPTPNPTPNPPKTFCQKLKFWK